MCILRTLTVLSITLTTTFAESNVSFWFSPDTEARIEAEQLLTIRVQGEINGTELGTIYVQVENTEVAKIVGNSTVLFERTPCVREGDSAIDITPRCFNISFKIEGVFLGRTRIKLYNDTTPGTDKDAVPFYDKYPVVVLRQYSILSDLFLYTLIAMICLNTIGFGCTIDLQVMKEILKKPIAPAIGLGCQYILNPLLAYGWAKLYGLPSAMAVGLFAIGCSPGGGGSNLWTYLLDGDLNLSILMTLISLTASLGLMPLWLFTLGRTLMPDDLDIPYQNVFYSLIGLIVPCFLGVLIKKFHPKTAMKIKKLITPLALLILLYILTAGIYSNRYMFVLMKDWRVLVSGLSLPYSVYLISAVIAWICRQPKNRIITISIESAVQNTAIAIVMLTLSFPQPDADIAAVIPVAATIFTPSPLYIILLIKFIRKRCCNSEKKKVEIDPDTNTTITYTVGEKNEESNFKTNDNSTVTYTTDSSS